MADRVYRARMAALTKPSQVRIRVTDEDAETLDKLAGEVLSRADVASVLLHAAIESIRKNKGRVAFPPEFEVQVVEGIPEKALRTDRARR